MTEDGSPPRFVEFDTRHWPGRDGRDSGPRWTPRASAAVLLSLAFLAVPIRLALRGDDPAPVEVLLVLLVAAYGTGFVLAVRFAARTPPRTRTVLVGVLLLGGLAIPAGLRDASMLPYLTYAVVAAVLTFPVRYSRVVGLVAALTVVVLSWSADGRPDWAGAGAIALLTVAVSALLLLNQTVARLRLANGVIAELATSRERTRLARDLHDLLGHSLATITVKSGLLRRMIESGAPPEAALTEVREVEQLSRQAMGEVRAAVSGYHAISLATELAGVRLALRAAGIEARLPHAVDDLRPDLQEPFAWALREGVTNVIKHSRATWCEVRIGATWLEVRDDGRGPDDGARAGGDTGHGLDGLRDRMRPVGAIVRAGAAPGGGFRLRVALA